LKWMLRKNPAQDKVIHKQACNNRGLIEKPNYLATGLIYKFL
jgi:hypothetical protein